MIFSTPDNLIVPPKPTSHALCGCWSLRALRMYIPTYLATNRGVSVGVVHPEKVRRVELAVHDGRCRLLAGHRPHAQNVLE